MQLHAAKNINMFELSEETSLGLTVATATFVGCRALYSALTAFGSDGAVPVDSSSAKSKGKGEKGEKTKTNLRNRKATDAAATKVMEGGSAGADARAAGDAEFQPKKSRAPVTAARKAIAWVCLLHAYVVGTVSSLFVYWNYHLISDAATMFDCPVNPQLWEGGRTLAVAATGVSVGYMLHDLIAMLENRLFEDAPLYSVHMHHVICIFCFGLTIVESPSKACAIAVCLVCEINTATLHTRRSLIWLGFHPSSWPCALSDFCTMVTMLPTRQFLHWTVSYNLYIARATISTFDFWVMVVGMIGLNAIDLLLVVDIIRGRIKRNKSYDA